MTSTVSPPQKVGSIPQEVVTVAVLISATGSQVLLVDDAAVHPCPNSVAPELDSTGDFLICN